MADPLLLAFDTSGPYCSAAIAQGAKLIASNHQPMAKGQVEHLMVLIEEMLQGAGLTYAQLNRIAVGTGPGNFTGIRISVSAARGLALSLGIPATGVTSFDALGVGVPRPYLACLQATRSDLHFCEVHADWRSDPWQARLEDIPAPKDPACLCIGHRAEEVAAHLGLTHHPETHTPAEAIALYAASHPFDPAARPTPTYLRPADAAPPRDPAPVILD